MKIKQTLFLLAAGVAAGILLAPHSGAKTRKKIKKRAVDVLGGLNDKISDASDTLKEKIGKVQENIKEA